jgi:hypothetical protein
VEKIDYKKELAALYRPSAKKVVTVDVPAFNFIMTDGQGDPGSEVFAAAVEALFSVSYTLKSMIKKGPRQLDYGVLPLEALWSADDPTAFTEGRKDEWCWSAMIMQPEFIDEELYAQAIAQVTKKKPLAALEKLRFESFTEGQAAQTLHLGPFSEEGPTVERVHQFIASEGRVLCGRHHEIYLSDIRKAAPAKWKTVIRQPYR